MRRGEPDITTCRLGCSSASNWLNIYIYYTYRERESERRVYIYIMHIDAYWKTAMEPSNISMLVFTAIS
jgi:hypothetical protein